MFFDILSIFEIFQKKMKINFLYKKTPTYGT